ncbi:hypothetical protein EK21DRAFT_112831 [Setomelanomma holmii]|uniref:Peptidase M43 pregnancy-associated plasma-A domain-containing protein n=1 Tax=Setomelanomma holmii TaxID=210430 RepID=A0A9P4H8H0_9PLEO|nr:hypothetical protein EK21DRAFT_112831 [Setomelanomma holmii]
MTEVSLEDPILDGVRLRTDGTDGSRPDRSRRLSLVHEVGHWLGLLHTFQCGCKDTEIIRGEEVQGDGVDDTPAEDQDAFDEWPRSCKRRTNFCLDGGPDPIHNYMNYKDE